MTNDKFKQAINIKNKIDSLMAIDTVLVKASAGSNVLAAVDIDSADRLSVLDTTSLCKELLHDFRQVISVKVLQLNKEFEAL